jgi:hypothetical protein
MFRPILGHIRVVGPKHVVVEYMYTLCINCVVFWLLIIHYYLFTEHNGDVTLKNLSLKFQPTFTKRTRFYWEGNLKHKIFSIVFPVINVFLISWHPPTPPYFPLSPHHTASSRNWSTIFKFVTSKSWHNNSLLLTSHLHVIESLVCSVNV